MAPSVFRSKVGYAMLAFECLTAHLFLVSKSRQLTMRTINPATTENASVAKANPMALLDTSNRKHPPHAARGTIKRRVKTSHQLTGGGVVDFETLLDR